MSAASTEGPLGPEALRRVRALVDESERRQQRELALRLGEAMREVNAQRQEDLVRIDRNIGAMQSNTGREMLRQRSEMLNYVTVRTAAGRRERSKGRMIVKRMALVVLGAVTVNAAVANGQTATTSTT